MMDDSISMARPIYLVGGDRVDVIGSQVSAPILSIAHGNVEYIKTEHSNYLTL